MYVCTMYTNIEIFNGIYYKINLFDMYVVRHLYINI